MQEEKNIPTALSIVRRAWELVRTHARIVAVIMVCLIAFHTLQEGIARMAGLGEESIARFVYDLPWVVLQMTITVAVTRFALGFVDGGTGVWGTRKQIMWDVLRYFGTTVILGFFMVVPLAIPVLVGVWMGVSMTSLIVSVPLLLCGLIALLLVVVCLFYWQFALMVVVERHVWGVTALRQSWHIVRGHEWLAVRVGIVLLGVNLLGLLLLGIGLLITVPVSFVASLVLYRACAGATQSAVSVDTSAPAPAEEVIAETAAPEDVKQA